MRSAPRVTGVARYNNDVDDPADYFREAMDHMASFDIVNHSWGFGPFNVEPGEESYEAPAMPYEHRRDNGRDGLGTIIVIAGGNRRFEVSRRRWRG